MFLAPEWEQKLADHHVFRPATNLLDGDEASSADNKPEAVANHTQGSGNYPPFFRGNISLDPGLPGEQSAVNYIGFAIAGSADFRQWSESEGTPKFRHSSDLNKLDIDHGSDDGSVVEIPSSGLSNIERDITSAPAIGSYVNPEHYTSLHEQDNTEVSRQDISTQSAEIPPQQAVGLSSPFYSRVPIPYYKDLRNRLAECEARKVFNLSFSSNWEASAQVTCLRSTSETGTSQNRSTLCSFGMDLTSSTALSAVAGVVLWKISRRRENKARIGHARQWQLEN